MKSKTLDEIIFGATLFHVAAFHFANVFGPAYNAVTESQSFPYAIGLMGGTISNAIYGVCLSSKDKKEIVKKSFLDGAAFGATVSAAEIALAHGGGKLIGYLENYLIL